MSIDQATFERLIIAIHAAPLEPGGWGHVARQLCNIVGAERAVMLRLGATPSERPWALPLEFDPAALTEYALHWAPHDLLLLGAQAKGRVVAGIVSTDEQVIDRGAYLSSAYYNEYLRLADVERQINICLTAPDPIARVGPSAITLYRGVGKAPFNQDEAALLRRLAPHLALAARTTWRLEEAALIEPAYRGALDAIRIPAFAIDSLGRVAFMNSAAELEHRSGRWIEIRQGCLIAAPGLKRPDRTRLSDAVVRLRGGSAATFRIHDVGGTTQAVVAAAPFTRTGALSELHREVVGMVWLIPCAIDSAPSRAMARLFGLTPAEERLLRRLIAGDDLHAAAEALGLSVHTVRNQLKSTFQRTEVRSQTQLMAMAHRLAAIQLNDASPGGRPPDVTDGKAS